MTRIYDLGVSEDLKALRAQRSTMLSRTYKVVFNAFDDLSLRFRIGRPHVARALGVKHIRPRATWKNLYHDIALGVVRLRDAVQDDEVGTWTLRVDGTRRRVNLDSVPDGAYRSVTDWRHVLEFVTAQGWSYQAFARLVGCDTGQISRLSWGTSRPRITMGESVLWAARHVKKGTVITPPPTSERFRYPAPRLTEAERNDPFAFPDPLQ